MRHLTLRPGLHGFGLVLATHLLLSACKPAHQNQVSSSGSPALQALHDDSLLNLGLNLVRIGRVEVDKPSQMLFDAEGIRTLKAELKAATGMSAMKSILSTAAGVDGESPWRFVKCEAKLGAGESRNPRDCDHLARDWGAAFDFFIMAADHSGKECPTLLQSGCAIRQGLRVRAWELGSELVRPSVFVRREPVRSELITLLMRASTESKNVGFVTVTGGQFSRDFGDRVATELGRPGYRFANLIHISNHWTENYNRMRLDQARKDAGAIVSVIAVLATGGLATPALGGAQLGKAAQVIRFLEMTGAGATLATSAAILLRAESMVNELPEGPARDSLKTALFVMDKMQWLEAAGISHKVYQGVAKIILRSKRLHHIAQLKKIRMERLSQAEVQRGVAEADAAIPQVVANLKSRQISMATQTIEATSAGKNSVVQIDDVIKKSSEKAPDSAFVSSAPNVTTASGFIRLEQPLSPAELQEASTDVFQKIVGSSATEAEKLAAIKKLGEKMIVGDLNDSASSIHSLADLSDSFRLQADDALLATSRKIFEQVDAKTCDSACFSDLVQEMFPAINLKNKGALLKHAMEVEGGMKAAARAGSFPQIFRSWLDARNLDEAKAAIRQIAEDANTLNEVNRVRLKDGNCFNATVTMIQRLRGKNATAIPYGLPSERNSAKQMDDLITAVGEKIARSSTSIPSSRASPNVLSHFRSMAETEAWLAKNLGEGQVALFSSFAAKPQGGGNAGHATFVIKRFGQIIHINNQTQDDIISTLGEWDQIFKTKYNPDAVSFGYGAYVLQRRIAP